MIRKTWFNSLEPNVLYYQYLFDNPDEAANFHPSLEEETISFLFCKDDYNYTLITKCPKQNPVISFLNNK